MSDKNINEPGMGNGLPEDSRHEAEQPREDVEIVQAEEKGITSDIEAAQEINTEKKEKPAKKGKGNKMKDFRQLKHGSYSIALSLIVIVAVIMINLIVGQIPSQYTQIDLSGQQLSVLTDTTKELVEGLTEDVTIYYILEDSNRDTTVSRLLERYNDLSSHLTVVEKDPVLYPQFTSQYTDETLTDNSVIIVCGDDSKVVEYDDMYEVEYSYSYYSYSSSTTGFDAEGQITSAIAALVSDDLPKLYTLTGHNELELTDTLTSSIEKENIEIEELSLLSSDGVPEDADCLMILSPTSDISSTEAQMILNYLRRGGSAIIITDYTSEELPNLATVLEYYGTELVEGIIFEGNANYYYSQYLYYLLPDINSTDVSSDLASAGSYVMLASAQGIETAEDARDTLTIDSVLTTSDQAYSKVNVQNMTTYSQEDDDISGPFDIGVIITETVELTDELLEETAEVDEDLDLDSWIDSIEIETETETEETEDTAEEESEAAADAEEESEDSAVAETETETETETEEAADEAETRIAVYTSSALANDSVNQAVSGGNYQLLVNTVSWACNQESSVSVPSKSTVVDYLTLTTASVNFWALVTTVILPLLILFIGLGIWMSRRKR
ncbi:MAG: Gldg family protein [Clostridiales bacterium]|nr:Gldg family protein [Clostridiales bacterium]